MNDDLLQLLKVKKIPQDNIKHNFFIETQKLPNIIDKTKEKLVSKEEFLSKISDKINIVNKKLSKENLYVKTQQDKLSLKPLETAINEKDKDLINDDTIINIKKTKKKFIIKLLKISISKSLSKQIKSLTSVERLTDKPKSNKTYLDKYKETFIKDIDIDPNLSINNTKIKERMPKTTDDIKLKVSEYYLNNRETFINFINNLFLPYKEILLEEEKLIQQNKDKNSNDIKLQDLGNDKFSLLTHQKIVKQYMSLYSPYRGLLLFHGLGSGKTCSSIAITEGLKNDKQVIVMTPASLRDNYIEELKKCGDFLYKKNQFWEFISIKENPEYLTTLSSILKLPEDYIKKNNGAWFINSKKESNFNELTYDEQEKINEQINKMIMYKYKFISYNGLRQSHIQSLSENYEINPFTNKVVVIDEAHNFVSRIVNKLRTNNKSSISLKLYEYLLSAENCKIVLLSGTPIINYPNEIATLYNILRGYIYVLSCKLIETNKKYNESNLIKLLKDNNLYQHIDIISYNNLTKTLTITKNPFNFVKSDNEDKNMVEFSKETIYLNAFIDKLLDIFMKNNVNLTYNIKNGKKQYVNVEAKLCLPDDSEKFKEIFIDKNSNVKNSEMFKKRIIGLTSYFRSAQEGLMPDYNFKDNFKIKEIEFSDFQFGIYEEARAQERTMEKKNKQKKKKKPDDIYDETVSTYRIFSRAFCNFVFPKQHIKRPMPKEDENIEALLENIDKKENINEDFIDNLSIDEKLQNEDLNQEYEDVEKNVKLEKELKDDSYQSRIVKALQELENNADKYLTPEGLNTYSPKFLNILENISDEEYKGIHLLYSQFKTLEGIGIFKLVLKQNGYIEFKLKLDKKSGNYLLDIDEDDLDKPMFACYTGSESVEEKEIIKNVLNSNWKLVPSTILSVINKKSKNNFYGEIIKLLMITASGAEGISLKNVRYVHIMEPYWHPVRIQQVIGRARRIYSHFDLPKEYQNVNVFLYLMKISEKQLETASTELKLKDISKIEGKPISSDQFLYEISTIKEKINEDLLKNVKESSIDCLVHKKTGSKEQLNCLSIGNPNNKNLLYELDIEKEKEDKHIKMNVKQLGYKFVVPKVLKDTNYVLRKDTTEVYDKHAIQNDNLIMIGNLEAINGKYVIKKNEGDLIEL
jgi:hypothetical protein